MSKTFIQIGDVEVDSDNFNVPSSRTFRDAWSLTGNLDVNVISVDMELAREIWRSKIRQARKPELEKLDISYMQMLEKGDIEAQATIVSAKQVLRDAPSDPAIEEATTPEELIEVQPANLKILI